MQQQFRAPFEVILFGGIEAHSSFKLMHGGQWIASLLVKFAGQTMQVGDLAMCQQALHVLPGKR